MLLEELLDAARSLDRVDVMTADEASGAPEIAWGDSFVSYVPVDPQPGDQREFPFATVVTKDYPDFDTFSELDRDGAWRVNVCVGRREYERLFGHRPGEFEAHRAEFDATARDTLIPHPVYASQGWVSVVDPGEQAGDEAIRLLGLAHARAAGRHRARAERSPADG